ncbi:MAG TPA: hypothetical protein VIE66_21140 [Methylocella sp.]
MELIRLVLLAVFGVLAAAISRQLADEFKAWTPQLIRHLIKSAVRQLPENQRERYTEEWQSHVDSVPGEVGKLIVAFGFLQASWKISRGLPTDIPYAAAERVSGITTGSNVFCSSCGAPIKGEPPIPDDPVQRKPCP